MKRTIACLLPLLLIVACNGGKKDADVLDRLVPANAGVYMKIQNLKGLDAEISEIARVIEPAVRETAYAQEAVGQMLSCPGLRGVDLDRPIGQVVVMMGGQPLDMALIPVTSRVEFEKGMAEGPYWEYRKDSVHMKFLEGYAVVTGAPQALDLVSLGSSPAPISEDLSDVHLAMAVDMEQFGELLEQGIAELAEMMDQVSSNPDTPPVLGDFMQLYLDAAEKVFAEAAGMRLGLSMANGGVEFDFTLTAKDGTDLADLFAGRSASPCRYLPLLSTNRCMAMEAHASPETVRKVYGPIYEVLFAGLEQADRDLLLESMTLSDGGAFAMDLSNGISGTGITHLLDVEAYRRVSAELAARLDEVMKGYMSTFLPPEARNELGELPFRIQITPGEPWEHAGVPVEVTTVSMEISDELAENVPEAVGRVLRTLFGGEAFVVHEAIVGDLSLMAMGSGAKEELSALIDRVKSGNVPDLPAHLGGAFAGFPETTNMVFNLDLSEIAGFIGNLDIDLGLSDQQKALLTSPPSGLTLSAYMTAGDGSMRYGGRLALTEIIKYLKPLLDEVDMFPAATAKKDQLSCMNNLKQIGGMLATLRAGRGYQHYDGPAFILQVAKDIKDEDLEIFICPAEPPSAAPDRPPVGSAEFVRMYREMDLTKDRDWSSYTSYAGPNWSEFPEDPLARESRLWACDRCANGHSHHGGVMVLYDSTKVRLLDVEDLEGHVDPWSILVGPNSPAGLLSKMIFNRE